MILLSSREDLIFFWQAVRIGADHLNPIRDCQTWDWVSDTIKIGLCVVYSHSYGVALQRIPTANLGPEQQQTIESSTQLPWLLFVSYTLISFYSLIQNSLRVGKHLQREPSTVYIYLLSLLNLDSSSLDWFRSSTMPSNGFFSLAFQVVSRSLSLIQVSPQRQKWRFRWRLEDNIRI